MPKRKDPPLSDEEQRKRFEALAREVGARQSTEEFKKTLKKTLRSTLQRKGKAALKRD